MTSDAVLALAAVAALGISVLSPTLLRPWLESMGVVDVASARSSHVGTVVRGLGIACAAAFVLVFALVLALSPSVREQPLAWAVLVSGTVCGGLGWAEDLWGVGVGPRFLVQVLLGVGVTAWMADAAGVSPWFAAVGAVGVPALVNAVNFMDGVNGISGLYGLVAGGWFALLGAESGLTWLTVGGLVVAAAYVGFLPWNFGWFRWPASFMGDAGSYLLGGALAAMAFGAFFAGVHVESVVAPFLVYLADTGFTLARRILEGKPWTQPHREHVYQRLTDVGMSHVGSALTVVGCTALACWFGSLGAAAGDQPVNPAAFATVLLVLVYLSLPWALGRFAGRKGSAS
ncbi:UDP-phosphate glycosyltransferase [Arthrobacter sp. UM1]|uniref:UDP-phosphate glycosyltransferase n=1 Tax=Arthrobacter sp. UM1 TaxID=2766776 RepID=UPI001CF6CC06|nr:UDP-phosphate glycosyltransferase [Arthrobacter sp. UM1]MCB4207230.1 UDP-phosphate glycosyltransferase [Arthrobacter sp. UM1]